MIPPDSTWDISFFSMEEQFFITCIKVIDLGLWFPQGINTYWFYLSYQFLLQRQSIITCIRFIDLGLWNPWVLLLTDSTWAISFFSMEKQFFIKCIRFTGLGLWFPLGYNYLLILPELSVSSPETINYYMYKVHRPGVMIPPGYNYFLIQSELSVSSPWTIKYL